MIREVKESVPEAVTWRCADILGSINMAQNEASEMSDNDRNREAKLHFLGWILFILCAVLYTASSIRNHDVLAIAASILFLVGCVVFMIPLVTTMMQERVDRVPE
jgi:predicted membrane channel-forming protein YqfA (hemolysin III family)